MWDSNTRPEIMAVPSVKVVSLHLLATLEGLFSKYGTIMLPVKSRRAGQQTTTQGSILSMPQSYSEFRKENYTKPAIVSPLFLLLILYFIVNERRYQTVSSLALPLLTQKVSCLNLGLGTSLPRDRISSIFWNFPYVDTGTAVLQYRSRPLPSTCFPIYN
jgi:hypothetical protein